jgi:hypothetical protein
MVGRSFRSNLFQPTKLEPLLRRRRPSSIPLHPALSTRNPYHISVSDQHIIVSIHPYIMSSSTEPTKSQLRRWKKIIRQENPDMSDIAQADLLHRRIHGSNADNILIPIQQPQAPGTSRIARRRRAQQAKQIEAAISTPSFTQKKLSTRAQRRRKQHEALAAPSPPPAITTTIRRSSRLINHITMPTVSVEIPDSRQHRDNTFVPDADEESDQELSAQEDSPSI